MKALEGNMLPTLEDDKANSESKITSAIQLSDKESADRLNQLQNANLSSSDISGDSQMLQDPEQSPKHKLLRYNNSKFRSILRDVSNSAGGMGLGMSTRVGLSSYGPASVTEIEEDGNGFESTYSPFKRHSYFAYALPENTYSVILISPLQRGGYDCFNCFGMNMFFLHCLNLTVQGLLVWFIAEMVDESESKGENCSDSILFFLCLVVFTANLLSELMKTILMTLWILFFNTLQHEELNIHVDSLGNRRINSGITPWYKFVMIAVVSVPRGAVCVAMIYLGGKFLAAAESEQDLLIDTLALVFVTEVDEIFYDLFTPQVVRRVIQDLPPLIFLGDDVSDHRGWFHHLDEKGAFLFYGSLVGAATWLIHISHCLDEYK